MNPFIQKTFRGGLNQFVDPTKIGDDQYMLLLNGRVRYDVVEPLAKPMQQTFGLPGINNFQGIYAAGQYLLAFADGIAYYRDVSANQNFIPVQGWNVMDPTVARIYAQDVSSSTINLKRTAGSADANNVPIANTGVLFSTILNSSPTCVICQDGDNIPNIILPNGTSRQAQTYANWTKDNPEYVPIGLNMFKQGGTLFILGPDRDGVTRSVDGQPLNFVIAVDVNGDKASDEIFGKHYVGFAKIAGIHPTNSAEGVWVVSSPNGTTLVAPKEGSTIFGEPLFSNVPMFPTGVLNQFSYLDLSGDAVLIDGAGIKSFNAVAQLRNTGRNSPFSAPISNLFSGVSQNENNCSVLFDDYALFSVNTRYGHGIVVYDTIYQKFVGVDFPSFVSDDEYVKQFAVVDLVGIRKVFAITTANRLYELYASDEVEECSIYLGEWLTNDPKQEQQVFTLRTVFNDAIEQGTVFADLYNDRARVASLDANIISTIDEVLPPVTPPFGDDPQEDSVKNLAFYFSDLSDTAWKVGVWLRWAFKAKLSHVSLESRPIMMQNNTEQGAREFAAVMEGLPRIVAITPTEVVVGTIVTVTGANLSGVRSVKIGSITQTGLVTTSSGLRFTVAAGSATNKISIVKPNSIITSSQTLTVS